MSITKIKNYTQFVNENLGGGLKDFKGKRIFEAEEGEVEKLDFKKAFLDGGVKDTEYSKYLDGDEFTFISHSVFLDEGFFKLLDRTFNKNPKFKQQFFKFVKTDSEFKYLCDSIIMSDNGRPNPSDLVFTPNGLSFKNKTTSITIKSSGSNTPTAVLFAPMNLESVGFVGSIKNREWADSFKNCKINRLYLDTSDINVNSFGESFSNFVKTSNLKILNIGRSGDVSALFSKNTQPICTLESVKINNTAGLLDLSSFKQPIYSIFKSTNLEIGGDRRFNSIIGKNKVFINSEKTTINFKDLELQSSIDEMNLSFLNFEGSVNIESGAKNCNIAGLPTSKTNSLAVGSEVKLTDEAKKMLQNLTPGKEGGGEPDNNSYSYKGNYTSLNEAKSCKPKVTKFLKDKECEGINYITGTCKVGTKTMKIEKALIKLEAPESLIKSYSEECTKEVNEALKLMRRR